MPTLNWIGKDAVINHHLEVPYCTLEHKYTFGNAESGNKIIHGDNLLALKALLPEYEGRIKCIYIDPPYNTGNEQWVYNDNVNSPRMRRWLSEVVGREGEDLTRHDKWLCMMYPRLRLLHKLLADDGAIFISIDDNEQANLKLICDEIFGAGNFVGMITRRQSSGSKNDKGNDKIVTTADYILAYKKGSFFFSPYKVENKKSFSYQDKDGFFSTRALEMLGGGDTLPERSKMGYSVYFKESTNEVRLLFDYDLDNNPVYEKPNKELLEQGFYCYRPRKRGSEYGRWRWGEETFIERFNNNLVHFEKGRVFIKERQTDSIEKYPEAIWSEYLNTQGTNDLKSIFDERVFDFPKPTELIKFLLSVATDKSSIILDSFAGSGTTAHAVLNLNKQDGGNRKFILVEMEDYAESITAERVRRVIKGYGEGKNAAEGTGGGFEFYELGEPLFDGEYLNEKQPTERIRQYIFYTETRQPLPPAAAGNNPYLLGTHNNVDYYFYYEKERVTELDMSFVRAMEHGAEQYVVYADVCLLTADILRQLNITFRQIPRDFRRI